MGKKQMNKVNYQELFNEILISITVTVICVITLSISFEKSETNNNISTASGACVRG
jgi:hypothetical protein